MAQFENNATLFSSSNGNEFENEFDDETTSFVERIAMKVMEQAVMRDFNPSSPPNTPMGLGYLKEVRALREEEVSATSNPLIYNIQPLQPTPKAKVVTFAPEKTKEEIDAEEEEVMFRREQQETSGGVLITREREYIIPFNGSYQR